MLKDISRGARFTFVTMLLFGGAYHVTLWAVGQLMMPAQAEGSLLRRSDGSVIGSRLIAQKFEDPAYFHPRPSPVDYDAASAGGSNYGPSNPEHLEAVRRRIAAIEAEDGVAAAEIPSEMVTASGAGLDPHLPPVAAELQAPRIARRRQVAVGEVRALIAEHTQPPTLSFLGRARINVLELNLALDDRFGNPAHLSRAGGPE